VGQGGVVCERQGRVGVGEAGEVVGGKGWWGGEVSGAGVSECNNNKMQPSPLAQSPIIVNTNNTTITASTTSRWATIKGQQHVSYLVPKSTTTVRSRNVNNRKMCVSFSTSTTITVPNTVTVW